MAIISTQFKAIYGGLVNNEKSFKDASGNDVHIRDNGVLVYIRDDSNGKIENVLLSFRENQPLPDFNNFKLMSEYIFTADFNITPVVNKEFGTVSQKSFNLKPYFSTMSALNFDVNAGIPKDKGAK